MLLVVFFAAFCDASARRTSFNAADVSPIAVLYIAIAYSTRGLSTVIRGGGRSVAAAVTATAAKVVILAVIGLYRPYTHKDGTPT